MRHRVAGRKLSRTSEHRVAMRRNIVCSLFEHETISTTLPKAKEVKPFAEKLITLAKKGDLASRRRAISLLGDRAIYSETDNGAERQGTVIGKLFSELGPRYIDRPGGYTRIIKLAKRRLGDQGSLCLLQLVEKEMAKKTKAKQKTSPAEEKPKQAAQEALEAEQPEETVDAEQAKPEESVESQAQAQPDAESDQQAESKDQKKSE